MARMLVIEDNPANLELMAYLLTAFGHTLLLASDGEEGLATARHAFAYLLGGRHMGKIVIRVAS